MRWTRRRKLLAAVGGPPALALVGASGFVIWACGGVQSPGTFEGPVHDYGSGPEPGPRSVNALVVMTWNIAYAHGRGSEGPGYYPISEEDSADRLARIGATIRDSGADVALLQEVDFGSDRSHRVDQLEALARATGLRHAARAVSWRARYVPFPYWPPSRHWGRMESGGAVLSRYPIEGNRVTLHPKPSANSWIYNAFYLFRYSQVVTIRWGEREVRVVNSHLEAYDRPNREAQAKGLAETVRDPAASGVVDVLGGDLNAPPPEAGVRHGFPDEPGADFREDTTLDIIRGIPGLRELTDPGAVAEESAGFTFPAWAPSRRLDHLFARDGLEVKSVRVLQTGDLSDHLPVVAELAWPAR